MGTTRNGMGSKIRLKPQRLGLKGEGKLAVQQRRVELKGECVIKTRRRGTAKKVGVLCDV